VATGNIGGVNGNAETAVFTNANTGGTGQFSDVHVFSCAGATVTRIVSAGVGDRADDGIRAMSMAGGKLYIDRFTDAAGACCPMAAVRQAFTLAGSSLVATGAPVKRKFMSLDPAAGETEIPISFLPGSSGALLFGDTASARPGGLNASAGQTFTIAVEAPAPGQPNVIVELLQGATVLGSTTSGGTTAVTLPTTGHYQLRVRPTTPGADAGFDLEITIV
jgi:hypothetical protein